MNVSKEKNAPWVRLGDYIEQTDERNSDDKLNENDVRGISTEKKFIETKANLDGVSLTSYKVVKPNEFVYVADTSRRGEKIALALNDSNESYLISSIYTTFRSKDENILLPEYLYLLLSRSEFDRYSRFNSWGSARETFDWQEMCRVQIPLPSIETQKELVAVYNGLKELADQNEKLLEPLSKSCQAFIVDCKKKYESKRLGVFIEESDIKNSDNKIKAVKSVSVTKEFKETGAKVNKEELSGYKLVPPRHISYVQTTKNEKCFANALNTSNETYVVTSVNKVIKSKDENILDIGYLHLFLRREEFDRYAIFNSWGSAREVFSYDDLCEVQIPLPPIQIQQKIVDLYNCFEECKRIAATAREKIKNLCPALVQKAAHSL
ncbi:MAG: restriction endonuclease subunit S [Treponema sp.]|nr:restriction endonuclease subunit S [Spirochaetia bacterium]MDD7459259.1 restriction endonuclease subunit S [Spirochaetales bacterium]MDY5811331.1 restriction endonuclease subunit S [Treponema sp.]MEE1181695.1 restriction endonuclease subunit S [Treponema sp.]